MDIYVLNPSQEYGKKMVALCKGLKANKELSSEEYLKKGFTNYKAENLYLCRSISNADKYPVTFNLTIDKENKEIKSIGLLDENFLQPHFCNRNEYIQVEEIVNRLVKKNILIH